MTRFVVAAVIAAAATACSGASDPPVSAISDQRPASTAPASTATPGLKFDPSADPRKDLAAAVVQATATNRRIILDVGGEWCRWCHILDRFIVDHPELEAAIARDYVWLKINYSPENENAAFLKAYPKIAGYPHLFVLDPDGRLRHSQDTALLEEGPSYNLEKLRGFLAKWKL